MLALYIGNKNYSSWSLRSWLLMRVLDIPFVEQPVSLVSSEFKQVIAKRSPAGRVPILVDDDLVVWDTLAIAEYLAERYPALEVWPAEFRARARARSICAEMHSGFSALRNQMPMNLEASLPGRGWNTAVQGDVDRILQMWTDLLGTHHGPFLFGKFTAADAFFAPVVARLQTYGVALPALCTQYCQAVRALPAMVDWTEQALAEQEFVAEDEPYRSSR